MATRRSRRRSEAAPRLRVLAPGAPGPSEPGAPRARIHAAALRVFARHGYDGASLQMIADEVGLHKSTLFHHYRGKLDLAAEAFEDAMERVAERLRPLAEEASPRLETLLSVSDALVDHFAAEPDAARMVVWMMTAPSDSDLNLHIGRDDRHPVVTIFTTLWTWLERAQRAGAIRSVNLRQTIFNLVGLVVFYPAAAEANYLSGDEPFSAKACRIRREELRTVIGRALAPR
ncbi:MAG TPA: TetR/AcrR family transcriptional regulator [Myxococcota bacterium]|jgi:AcrR family transcriptional regulator|nr:TetR/AcrR family transcriptional regulator [Myxococcota bacterium]